MLAPLPATTFESDIPLSLARSAHSGTSHSPEKRGDQEVASYAAQLALDYNELAKLATTDEKIATLAAEFARYRAGYRARYVARLSAMSRCVSTLIAGPSNFNTRRHSKSSDRADKRTGELLDYRNAALAAIRKALQPELRPVMSGDNDAVERLTAKIAEAEAFQAQAKAINACIRKHAKAGVEAQVAALTALELPGRNGKKLSEDAARGLLKPDFAGRIGLASYELTNNAANIRRMKERLATISVAKATPWTAAEGEHARLEDDPGEHRVRLFFPGKPSAEVRERLKTTGFRWTPSKGCWQAYRNDRTIAAAKREAGVPATPAEVAPIAVPTCPECTEPTHPTESNDEGVCAPCLGDAAVLPGDDDKGGGGGDGDKPPCLLSMGCLCCLHARGARASVRCNADESVWPCRSCWAYFHDGGFEVDDQGRCIECKDTGIHPDEHGDPSKDDDANEDAAMVVRCPKCGTSSEDDEDNFKLCETFRAYHPFNPATGVANNALGTSCPSEHFDDGDGDYVLLCNHCTHEGSLSEFGAVLKDWE